MNDFVKNLIGIISVLISCYFAKKNIFTTRKIETTKAQLYSVYLPLFKKVEPFLYKDVSMEFVKALIDDFNELKTEHYELIDPNLINSFRLLNKYINDGKNFYEEYKDICYYIDKNFETSRKLLSLPTRGILYKLSNRQFPRDTIKAIDELISNLIMPLTLLAFVFFVFESIKFIIDVLKKLIY